MDKVKIIVCAHKADKNIRKGKPYFPLQVGKALHPEVDLGFACDNEGENISEKNARWNELTAIYWGWKNINSTEYVGLNHYRRYFGLVIDETNVDAVMAGYDVLTVKGRKSINFEVNKTDLTCATSQEDFWLFVDTLLGTYPQYKERIIDYFVNYNKSTPFNMFLAHKAIYDAYCQFIFPVLFNVENKVPEHGYSRQRRVIGYFGEMSLGLFIYCKQLKAREVPYVMCGDANHTNISYSMSVKGVVTHLIVMAKKLFRRKHTLVVPDDVRAGLRNDGIELHNI